MVFACGPRQAGKTIFAEIISQSYNNTLYFNWDIPEHRVELLKNPNFFEKVDRKDDSIPFIVLDEIHKFKDWKNYLKGIYDQFKNEFSFFVTGSGRLDIYQKGGDSLAGRYLMFHIWPLTLAEFSGEKLSITRFLEDPLSTTSPFLQDKWELLNSVSGFPEPFKKRNEASYRRWSNAYSKQLIREDVRDLSGIKAVSSMETLYYMLPERIGSPLSIPSLANDLKVSYNTVASWMALFERFFLIFSITPWSKGIKRTIHKERKIYLWDMPRIKDAGARFENAVALELYRAVTNWNDMGYGDFSIYFGRDKEKNEIDFIITKERKPFLIIETKLKDTSISKSFLNFQNYLNVPGIQLTNSGSTFKRISNNQHKILITPAAMWLPLLP